MAQLALYDPQVPQRPAFRRRDESQVPLCAACRGREARYGFQPDGNDPQMERPRTLCFDCFRLELSRRQEAARAVQPRLPIDRTLEALNRRRRRAQIAARKALGL